MDEQLQLFDDSGYRTTLQKYRRKPTEPIEAVQLRWRTWNEVCEFLGDALTDENPTGAWNIDEPLDDCGEQGPFIALMVRTAQDQPVTVRHGEWILRDKGEGRFYPVAPDIFEATYEAC